MISNPAAWVPSLPGEMVISFFYLLQIVLFIVVASIVCGGVVSSVFSCVVHGAISSLAIIRKRKLVALLKLYCGCLCFVSLPYGAMSWSTVCM